MSNTVVYDANANESDLAVALGDLNPPVGAYRLMWLAVVDGAQRWTHNLVQCTLSYNKETQAYALMLNNLVA